MSIRGFINRFLKSFETEFYTFNRIEIYQEHILHNYDEVQKNNPKSNIWPVLKSNAYGHGLQEVATILKKRKPKYYVVDSYYEALKIWEVAPRQDVLLIGYTDPLNFPNMKWKHLGIVVYDMDTLKHLAALKKKVNIHLKINTGMNRQGISPKELDLFINAIQCFSWLTLEGVCTHLADADGETEDFTTTQKKVFKTVLNKIKQENLTPQYVHVANTAGSSKDSNNDVNSVRLGLGLYGFNPLHKKDPGYGKLKNLKPALRFLSSIIKVNELQKGDKVSYNCTFTAPKKMRVGVLPIGYYEIFDRRLSNLGFVHYKKTPLPIVGRICMNLTVVDIKNKKINIGDEVEVLGLNQENKNSVTSMANVCKTIPYEILVNINEITRRVVV